MVHKLGDRVKETTTTAGTGNISLAGAVTGFMAFSAVLVNNDTTLYAIVAQTPGQWEVGVGTWQTGNTLVRTAPLAGSAATPVNFSAGTKDVFITTGSGDPIYYPVRTTEPSNPPADALALYGKYIAGRAMVKQKGPSGLETPLQPSFFQNTVRLMSPNTTTTMGLIGGAATNVGTLSHPTPTATSFGFATNVASAATANTGAGVSDSLLYFLRGDGTAGQADGFFFAVRFFFPAAGDIVNSGFFAGVSNGTLVNMASGTAPAFMYAGLHQHDAAAAPRDTKFAFVTRNAGTAVVQDTGQVITINKLYDFYMFSPPYGGAAPTLSMQLVNITDGVTSVHTFPNTEAQLPAATTLMRSMAGALTTEAVAKNVRIKKLYIETDL